MRLVTLGARTTRVINLYFAVQWILYIVTGAPTIVLDSCQRHVFSITVMGKLVTQGQGVQSSVG